LNINAVQESIDAVPDGCGRGGELRTISFNHKLAVAEGDTLFGGRGLCWDRSGGAGEGLFVILWFFFFFPATRTRVPWGAVGAVVEAGVS
jgi:hypothetical protein